jgi:hypothetical protein
VTVVILLVLVAILWIVVLAPSVWRRWAERQGAGSIDHFHHQLELLEHAGPKLVTPAYRLHTARPQETRSGSFTSAKVAATRPQLMLLRPVDDEDSADIDGQDGAHYERVGVLDVPDPPVDPEQTRAGLAAYRRQQAKHRCTVMLRLLTATAVSTGLLGMLPSLHLAWIATALSGLAAITLVGLIAYSREVAVQRSAGRHVHRIEVETAQEAPPDVDAKWYAVVAAHSGFPGAWDDLDAAPPLRQAASGT